MLKCATGRAKDDNPKMPLNRPFSCLRLTRRNVLSCQKQLGTRERTVVMPKADNQEATEAVSSCSHPVVFRDGVQVLTLD